METAVKYEYLFFSLLNQSAYEGNHSLHGENSNLGFIGAVHQSDMTKLDLTETANTGC